MLMMKSIMQILPITPVAVLAVVLLALGLGGMVATAWVAPPVKDAGLRPVQWR